CDLETLPWECAKQLPIAQLPGQISEQRRLPITWRRYNQRLIDARTLRIQQIRDDRQGDAWNLSSNSNVEAGNISNLSNRTFVQHYPACDAHAMSASDCDIAAAKLFFQRIERMIAELVEQLQTVVSD